MNGGPQQPETPILRLVQKNEAQQPTFEFCTECQQNVEGGPCPESKKGKLCTLGQQINSQRPCRIGPNHAKLKLFKGGKYDTSED